MLGPFDRLSLHDVACQRSCHGFWSVNLQSPVRAQWLVICMIIINRHGKKNVSADVAPSFLLSFKA
jgi:hypothetical protein